jgi:hypothetical protein
MLNFRRGDIVECIDAAPVRTESQVMPSEGQLYVVATVAPAGDGHSVRLQNLTPTCYLGGPCGCGHCGWDAARFRKVYRPKRELISFLSAGHRETV